MCNPIPQQRLTSHAAVIARHPSLPLWALHHEMHAHRKSLAFHFRQQVLHTGNSIGPSSRVVPILLLFRQRQTYFCALPVAITYSSDTFLAPGFSARAASVAATFSTPAPAPFPPIFLPSLPILPPRPPRPRPPLPPLLFSPPSPPSPRIPLFPCEASRSTLLSTPLPPPAASLLSAATLGGSDGAAAPEAGALEAPVEALPAPGALEALEALLAAAVGELFEFAAGASG